jgi:DNA-binding response OmpR family regulator
MCISAAGRAQTGRVRWQPMPARVAVFDDDASVLRLLQEILEGEEYSVVVCRSLLEVHQAAVRGASLAIVDSWGPGHLSLEQPERDQIVALARLVPTVLVSGRSWAARVSAAELGLIALVPKPFDLLLLLDIVHAHQHANAQAPAALRRAPAHVQDAHQPV